MKRQQTFCGLALLAAAGCAQALDIGGYSLPPVSFADTLVASSGVYTTAGGTLAQVVTDQSLASWAMSETPGAYLVLGFTDNVAVNGPGNDIVLFDRGHEAYEYSQEGFDSFNVTINGITRLYFTTETTTIVDDHNVNLTALDLSFFGVAEGASITQLQIGMDYRTRDTLPQLMLVAAVNSAPVPEPASWALLLGGAAALTAWRARRQATPGTAASNRA